MTRRYFNDYSRFELALLVIFVCLVGLGIGSAVWPDSDGDDTATPSTTAATASEEAATEDYGPSPSSSVEGEELPVKVKSAEPHLIDNHSSRSEMGLPPRAGYDAPLTEQVLDEIRADTLIMAGIRAKVSAGCEGGQVTVKAGQSTMCTVTYQGAKVRWDVYIERVTGNESSAIQLATYKIFPPDEGLLVAKSVYGQFWDLHHESSNELRCDRIPPFKRIPYDLASSEYEDTGYQCQYLETDFGPPRWVNEAVVLLESGVIFQEIRS
ncbi:hypothetical protein B7755_006900 [Streptomyces sp. NBS 14/10]|uniref:hypothetical protein n=1 Tax=unclassified Streptomyces TaxID=2593676 RepID=UPI000B7D7674|nr:hypothetical protein [Streptomyces sp. NBS 14/10]KAK1177911.1 hypothetical protein B7755_006900 [Streptomyces sp. NBS 14/10]MDW6062832.1 hypothetical protein [Streptomyces sp. FXJ1.4098]